MIPISDIKNKYGISMALTILCCRIYFKTAEIDDLKHFIANNKIDWQDCFKTCRKHRIRPLVYLILLKIKLTDEIKLKLNRELKQISIHNIKLSAETERLINLLNENEIKVLPYKGAAYSKQFFGNINMRESSDIDLIIDPNDLSKLFPIMEKQGFQSYQLEYYHRIGHKRFIQTHKDFNFDLFIGEKIEFHIEFHFNIINKNLHIHKELNYFDWNNTVKNQLINKQIPFLNPTEHFKAVSMHHMLQDQLGHLKTMVDLAQGMKWIENNNNQNDSNNSKKLILPLLDKKLNTNIVKKINNELLGIQFKHNFVQENKINIFTDFILSNSYQKMRDNKFPILDAIKYHYYIIKRTKQLYNNIPDKLHYLYNQVLSIIRPQVIDFKLIKINNRFYFLYYIARPLRLIFNPQNPQLATKKKIT